MSGGRQTAVLAVGALASIGLLAGCGGDSGGAAATPTAEGVGTVTTGADGVQEITLQTQDDYAFTPSTFTVEPGEVRLTVVNAAEQMTHNFEFAADEGPEPIAEKIPVLAPGEKKTIEFTVTQPGDHPFECTFHIQLGQVGTMTVRG